MAHALAIVRAVRIASVTALALLSGCVRALALPDAADRLERDARAILDAGARRLGAPGARPRVVVDTRRPCPAGRARRTAELAGLPRAEIDERLWEWDYGAYEGRTTPDIRKERPGWYLWADGVPGGETVEHVGERADAVIARVLPYLADGDVALVAHAHLLRVLTARRLGLPAVDGRLFRLDTCTISTLGTEHERPVIGSWNVPVAGGS